MSDEASERAARPMAATHGTVSAASSRQMPDEKSPYEQDRPEIPRVELPRGGGAL